MQEMEQGLREMGHENLDQDIYLNPGARGVGAKDPKALGAYQSSLRQNREQAFSNPNSKTKSDYLVEGMYDEVERDDGRRPSGQ